MTIGNINQILEIRVLPDLSSTFIVAVFLSENGWG